MQITTSPSWLYGRCWTFTIDKNATQIGPRFGLELAVFINQPRYSRLAPSAGIQVLVHPPGEMPFPDEDGISVPPGSEASVSVRMVGFFLLSCQKRLCFIMFPVKNAVIYNVSRRKRLFL